MVSPRVRREMVKFAISGFHLSQRRACRLVGILPSVFRYISRNHDLPGLRERLREHAAQRPKSGPKRPRDPLFEQEQTWGKVRVGCSICLKAET
ncbi:hypothetical protein D3C86_1910750 [compost metagenome]